MNPNQPVTPGTPDPDTTATSAVEAAIGLLLDARAGADSRDV